MVDATSSEGFLDISDVSYAIHKRNHLRCDASTEEQLKQKQYNWVFEV